MKLKTLITTFGALALSARADTLRHEVKAGLKALDADTATATPPKPVRVAALLRSYEARTTGKLRGAIHGARLEAVEASAALGWIA